MKPTVVLVHGAYAESSSWNGVLPALLDGGHRVIAFATPLRSVASDAALLTALVRSIEGPVLLVGALLRGRRSHRRRAGRGRRRRAGLRGGVRARPGGELRGCLRARARVDPRRDVDERPDRGRGRRHVHRPGEVPPPVRRRSAAGDAALMAVTQRPVTQAALFEPSGRNPLWRTVPSWFVFGELDHNIPVGAHRIMAERAGARRSVEIPGASHVVGVSHPAETAALIVEAAGQRPAGA